MRVEILGTGCSKCRLTEKVVRHVVDELGMGIEVCKVDDVEDIMERGVMMTPAVAINGEIQIMGRVPTEEELRELLAGGQG